MMQLLLSRGADPNAECGRALQTACHHRQLKAVQLLCEHGADVNMRCSGDGQRTTALSAAAEEGWIDLMQLLVSKGAVIDAESGLALQLACGSGQMLAVQWLLAHGADINTS